MIGLFKIEVRRDGLVAPAIGPAPELPVIYAERNVTVWANGPALSLGKHGCLIGHLFSRSRPSRRIEFLDPDAIDRILRTGGKSLTEDCWGAYVLVLQNGDGGVAIFRDPSGMLACYTRSSRDVTIFSSSCPLLLEGEAGTSLVDHLELARYLQCLDATGRVTALCGVNELIAGEACIVSPSRIAIETWWSPWKFALQAFTRTPAGLAEELRATLLDCIGAWASCLGSAVLGISGGLDSSIVAAALSMHDADLRTLTMFGLDAQGDERTYAACLATGLALPLTALPFDAGTIDVMAPVLPHLAWPLAGQFIQSTMAAHAAMDRSRRIDVLFSGNGGDNIFCHIQSASPLVDRWLAEGLGPGLWRTMTDLSDLTGSSLSMVAKAALQRWRRRGEGYRLLRDSSGLGGDILRQLARPVPLHPWLQDAASRPPGKLAHVGLLTRAHKSLEYYPRECSPPHISPLLSQPVVEQCLSVPSWEWISGGVNRAPARAAFSGLLPDAILKRRSKGGPTGFMVEFARTHSDQLQNLLQGGLLMNHGILDPDFLIQHDDRSTSGSTWAQRMLAFAGAETWARWWTSSPRDPAGLHWRPADASGDAAAIRAQSA